MARLLYACRFDLASASAFAEVSDEYSGWIERHYRDRRGLADFSIDVSSDESQPSLPDRHLFQRQKFAGAGGEVLRLIWAYPVDNDSGLEWRNEIRIGSFGDACAVEHLISINSIDYTIVPTQVLLGSPGVIRRLCTTRSVQVGEMSIEAKAYDLGSESMEQFAELLQSSDRRLPIVFISPYANGDRSDLDAAAMAQRLAGVAVVVQARDPDATWEMADVLGRSFSCFDGAARIYWPAFSTDQDPARHRLFLGSIIRTVGPRSVERSIERSIYAVAAFRFAPDIRLNEIMREAEQVERQQRLGMLKKSSGIDWEEISLSQDRELTEANQKISDLESEIANLKANQQILFSSRAVDEPGEIDANEQVVDPPKTVEDACIQAQEFANIVILESALHSSRESPFRRPSDILAALTSLEEIAAQGVDGDILQELKARGWGKRSSMHISDTTKAKYGKSYQFDYNGERQYFEPHITLGSGDANSCASIHFLIDNKIKKIVIGHVGRHLPNTKT